MWYVNVPLNLVIICFSVLGPPNLGNSLAGEEWSVLVLHMFFGRTIDAKRKNGVFALWCLDREKLQDFQLVGFLVPALGWSGLWCLYSLQLGVPLEKYPSKKHCSSLSWLCFALSSGLYVWLGLSLIY